MVIMFFLAEAIQAASELRVWVALTGDQFQSTTGGYAISREIEGAIKELKRAGMTSDIYIAVAHGMGGMCITTSFIQTVEL